MSHQGSVSGAVGFGVDVGGSGIKGAAVDLATGEFVGERTRLPTPSPATPDAVAELVAQLVHDAEAGGGAGEPGSPVGVTVPGIVDDGVVRSAANIDAAWIGTDADALFSARLGRPVHVVNDADAAGLAEVRWGAAREQRGLVLVTTLGTGIGAALVHDGVLVPNAELGHLEVGGRNAEQWTANSAREREELSWEDWADRLQVYYRHLERLFTPALFVVGGGVSKHADRFLPLLDLGTPIVPATLRNRAGIVGAAHQAAAHAAG